MTTPKSQNPEGKVVAWQYRSLLGDEGPGEWVNCDHTAYDLFSDSYYADRYEVRELIPATTHSDMQRRLEAAEANAARYLFLRGRSWGGSGAYYFKGPDYDGKLTLDAAIDKALALLRDGKGDGVSADEGEGRG